MNTAQSLLQRAGADLTPAAWQDATLLLIDHQRDYLDGSTPLHGIGPATEQVARLIAKARTEGTPVVHVVHHSEAGSFLFDPQGPGVDILAGLEPADGEPVVVKTRPNSFAGTDLHAVLQKLGRKQLIIAGFMTHMCVSATTRSALDHGYWSTVVADACATRDLPDPLGGVVPADTVHRVALTELADRFAVVVKDAGVLGA